MVKWIVVLLTAAIASSVFGEVGHETSLQSYVVSAHKRAFDDWGLLAYGAVRLAKSAVRTRLAVMGACSLEEFDVGLELGQCDPTLSTLFVTGSLNARMGAVHNGNLQGGRSSRISGTVRRDCAPEVSKVKSATHLLEFERTLVRDTSENCGLPPSEQAQRKVNESHTVFSPASGSYSCYTVFRVSTDDLLNAREWRYEGDTSKNIIINIVGRRAVIKDFVMRGFNAQRTLLVFCTTYGNFQVLNSRIHAPILAPTTTFTVMDTIVNGSLVTGSVRGKMVVLKNEYLPC